MQISFIIDLTKFILTHNYFAFLDKYFLQICCTATRASFAPSFANLFMGYWESRYIWASNPFGDHIIFFGQYIDDVLMIWQGPRDTLDNCIEYCNTNPFGICFTLVMDKDILRFLDLELTPNEKGDIITKTPFKPTSRNSYLYRQSCRLSRWKKNILRSQLYRLEELHSENRLHGTK